MNKSKLAIGIIGIAATVVFLVIAIISIAGNKSFSLLNSFVTELGKYPAGYLASAQQLTFNIGLVMSGLLVSVFMIGYGILKREKMFVFTAFFGVLTGVLIAAQGVITLNVASVQYIFTFMLFVSAALTCAMFIVSSLLADKLAQISLASVLVAFAAGVVSIIFAVFVQIGNIPRILSVPFELRITLIPFTMIEWAALLLIFAFVTLLGVKMVMNKEAHVPKTKAAKAPKAVQAKAPKAKAAKAPKTSKVKVPKVKVKKANNRNMDF